MMDWSEVKQLISTTERNLLGQQTELENDQEYQTNIRIRDTQKGSLSDDDLRDINRKITEHKSRLKVIGNRIMVIAGLRYVIDACDNQSVHLTEKVALSDACISAIGNGFTGEIPSVIKFWMQRSNPRENVSNHS